MHTFRGKSCKIFFNADMSGNINIIEDLTDEQIVVEADDILEFVAEYIRSKQISEIEQRDWKEFIK